MLLLRVNSGLLAVFLTFLLPLQAQNHASLTAREYYEGLLGAGGLVHMAGTYACFQDDPKVDSFFIVRESKNLRDDLLADGNFRKLPQTTQGLVQKDLLMIRGYPKGIPWREEEVLEKDEASWTSDERMLDERTPIRIRFSVDWQTLRYKYAVEVLNIDSTFHSEIASLGLCQEVPAEQHGDNSSVRKPIPEASLKPDSEIKKRSFSHVLPFRILP